MRICSHLLKKFLMEKFIFVHWFVQVSIQKTIVKKKITYYLKNYVAYLFTIFEESLQFAIFFTARYLDIRFWDLLYFICLKLSPQYWYLQKQPSRGVLRKRCSENMQQIYRRTPMPKCDFNKVSLRIYLNHTSAWAFSCKFPAYL